MKKIQLTFLSCLLIIAFEACDSSSDRKGEISTGLVGDWKVQWVTYPDKTAGPDDGINYTMNGLMNIRKDGSITINAYGYEGCIFGTDTLIHTLQWEVQSDTVLNLTNEGDKYGIPYTIKDFSEAKVKLQLVEDVFLFLTR